MAVRQFFVETLAISSFVCNTKEERRFDGTAKTTKYF